MKTSTVPPLKVDPQLRQDIESVITQGRPVAMSRPTLYWTAACQARGRQGAQQPFMSYAVRFNSKRGNGLARRTKIMPAVFTLVREARAVSAI